MYTISVALYHAFVEICLGETRAGMIPQARIDRSSRHIIAREIGTPVTSSKPLIGLHRKPGKPPK